MCTIRLGKRASELCVQVKRQTGLRHWNEVCRLALCVSLQQPQTPMIHDSTGAVTIEWSTLAGTRDCILSALLKKHDPRHLPRVVAAHVDRGLMTLVTCHWPRDIPKLIFNVCGSHAQTA